MRYVIAIVLTLVALTLSLVLWLRFEFARITADEQPLNVFSQVARPLAATAKPEPCDQVYSNTRAWFGALHVHTSASYDATAFGSTTTVDQAYGFARGETVSLKLQGDPVDHQAPQLTISSPLDFMAVTDHAEALGENRLCYTPDAAAYSTLVCRLFRGDIRLPVDDTLQPLMRLATQAVFGQDRSIRICGEDGSRCRQQAIAVWQENQRSTEAWHDGSSNCEFSTFHAYEYTLAEEASNLHRNVIFKSDSVPQAAFSAKDGPRPEQLWRWLDSSCIQGSDSCDALAIPHNSNWSSGRMWFPISALDQPLAQQQELAKLRQRLEPLAEIMQTKGDSECRNGIASVMGSADEFCDFEKLRPASERPQDCGETVGSGGMMLQGCTSRYSYVRYALTAGLKEQGKLGTNPFRLGIIAATDSHNGTPSAGIEQGHKGSHGTDRDINKRLKGKVEVPGGIATGSPVRYNPGGLAGIYARENSRNALFEAMQRRETFGTSGPRIRPRFFAGWDLPPTLCDSPSFLGQAYRSGVPMGSDLPANNKGASGSPQFIVSASADPRPGANLLQRIQVIKGWVDKQGRTHQTVYDVAGDPLNGASVDPSSCAVSGPGAKQLCAGWRDPDFRADQSAVYYARVLENPSCRWSHYDCLTLPADQRPATCSDPDLPWQIQERAWTSPVWYQGSE